MKVYVISVHWYSATDVLAVFDSHEKAVKFVEQHSKDTRNKNKYCCPNKSWHFITACRISTQQQKY
mgnify:CR=1 FL=1